MSSESEVSTQAGRGPNVSSGRRARLHHATRIPKDAAPVASQPFDVTNANRPAGSPKCATSGSGSSVLHAASKLVRRRGSSAMPKRAAL